MRQRSKKLNRYAYSNEIDYDHYSIIHELEKIDKAEQGMIAKAERTNRTIRNRSEETIAKQAKAFAAKEKADARIVELRPKLEGMLDGDLFNSLLTSFQESGISATIEQFRTELAEFKRDSDEFDELTQTSLSREMSYFNHFLYNLAKKYPPLIVYLPAKCFIHMGRNLPMSKLSKSQLDALEPRLESEGVFSDPMFKKLYIKFFPKHIAEITNVDDIAYALKLDPTSFNKLSPNGILRSSFWQNIYILDKLAKNAPIIVSYLTPEELEYYADKCTASIGLAIRECPSILENFPKNFFERHNPKFIFSNQRKHELKPLLEPYFDKFPTLAAYFDSKFIRPTGPKPKKQTTITFPIDF